MIETLRKMRGQKGFTLLELLVVVAIIAILATLILANLNRARKQAQDAKVQSEVKSISDAIQIYETDPSANLAALASAGVNVSATAPGPLAALNQATDPLLKQVPTHVAPGSYEYQGSVVGGTLSYVVAGDLVSKVGCYYVRDGVANTTAAACPAAGSITAVNLP